ncbi:MAG: amino acid permease [Cyanobacteria bacterium NC_groundwater_1444_Ag_S-0.65um_54_12]|nr:amino acid permease [Cyanobacteria bacterium NC_groundwater_1444_Ag_S-0.65um_54_12]
MPRSQTVDDSRDLASFGYLQKLDRSLGSFSSFAAGFSYISILTGLFQMFYLGFGAGGPGMFWTWPLVFAGQFMVALCFAELAAHFPLSGSVYQWSRRVGNGVVGKLAGWIYLACLVVTLAAVALALQVTLPQIAPWAQLIGHADNDMDAARNAVVLGCLLIAATTLINSVGVRALAKINNLGVVSEIVGVVLLIILLFAHVQRGPEVVLDTMGKTGQMGYLGPFLAAGLMASYVLYGFDTAGTLAEETSEPRRRVPLAILQALAAAGTAGALLLLAALLAAADIHSDRLASMNGGLPFIVRDTLGGVIGSIFLCAVVFAIFVCALAVHTGTVRLIFAMARDNCLPFSELLARVSERSRIPVIPAVLVGIVAALILLLNWNFSKVVGLVTSVAIVWANLGYLFVTAPLLWQRLHGWPHCRDIGPGVFSLGRWGLPINIAAVVWGCFMVANIAWPRHEVYGEAALQQWAAVIMTVFLLLAGGLYYGLVQRHKGGTLTSHQSGNRDQSQQSDVVSNA